MTITAGNEIKELTVDEYNTLIGDLQRIVDRSNAQNARILHLEQDGAKLREVMSQLLVVVEATICVDVLSPRSEATSQEKGGAE